jgi:hypothetical protein
VASAQILDEGVPGTDYSRAAELFESAHGPQPGLQFAVISFNHIINRYERSGVAGLAGRSALGGVLVAYGVTVRDRGAGSEAGWAGRCYAVGCEPVLLGGRPCDVPGCAARADP